MSESAVLKYCPQVFRAMKKVIGLFNKNTKYYAPRITK